jgi:hypothetical protein
VHPEEHMLTGTKEEEEEEDDDDEEEEEEEEEEPPQSYRGADKSLARPRRKQATGTEDIDVHISYL